MATTITDDLLEQAYESLGIGESTPSEKYGHVYSIRDEIYRIAKSKKFDIQHSTTGAISERLCQLGLESAVPNTYFKMPQSWKWVGDYYVLGAPFNTIVSVKSYKARERLLVSGTGNLLSPTIGWGLLDSPKEFSVSRLESYKYRAFMAIYAPQDKLLDHLSKEERAVTNINGNPLIRPLEDFVADLTRGVTLQTGVPRINPGLL
jgi:hypothetical protein